MYHKYQPKSVEELKSEWADSPRWQGIKRSYTAEEVDRLRGTFQHDHTIARMGAETLWELLHTEKFMRALGALTGNQA
ncbi:MAG: isocitrate lyase, partial [Anaerolineae bacterium]|nr:isocitrate lyase [Anaerolineae bacterium]